MIRITALVPRRLGVALLAALAGVLVTAAPAAAATSTTVTSQNWSGYAAHGSATKFQTVSARWRVPAATCVTGDQTFSSFWVGIGGYNTNSDGLEQDGTELDCSADGTQTVSAWYELLPAAPHTVSMTVKSGDLISAAVHVSQSKVTLTISDLTRREIFTRTVTDPDIDNTSAEWIAEAPSECTGDDDSTCSVLALADFGAVHFSNASATTTTGISSGISTSRWTTTKLLLGYEEESASFVALTSGASGTPSSLTDDGRQFTVTWSGTQTSATSTSGASSGSSGSGSGSSGSGSGGGSGGGVPNPGGGGLGGGGGGFGGPGGGGQNF